MNHLGLGWEYTLYQERGWCSGVYLPGGFGVRFENVVAITEHGCEVISELVQSLCPISYGLGC